MARVLPTPTAPPPVSDALEFGRPLDFVLTTDPRDLARALGEEKSRVYGLASTKVLSPDEMGEGPHA